MPALLASEGRIGQDHIEAVLVLDVGEVNLAEDFADFVFEGVRPAGPLFEGVQVGEELLVDEVAEVVAGFRPVVVDPAVVALGGCTFFPAVGLVEEIRVLLAVEGGFVGAVLLRAVEVVQPASFQRTSSMFLKACSNIVRVSIGNRRYRNPFYPLAGC